jgi:hypothetical protein
VLQLDGVYTNEEGKAAPVFVPAPEPEDEDVKSIVDIPTGCVFPPLFGRWLRRIG